MDVNKIDGGNVKTRKKNSATRNVGQCVESREGGKVQEWRNESNLTICRISTEFQNFSRRFVVNWSPHNNEMKDIMVESISKIPLQTKRGDSTAPHQIRLQTFQRQFLPFISMDFFHFHLFLIYRSYSLRSLR